MTKLPISLIYLTIDGPYVCSFSVGLKKNNQEEFECCWLFFNFNFLPIFNQFLDLKN